MTVLDLLKERLDLEDDYDIRCEVNYRIYILSSLADLKKDANKVTDINSFSRHQKSITKVIYHMTNDSSYKPWENKDLEKKFARILHKYSYYSQISNYKEIVTADLNAITKIWYEARQTIITLT